MIRIAIPDEDALQVLDGRILVLCRNAPGPDGMVAGPFEQITAADLPASQVAVGREELAVLLNYTHNLVVRGALGLTPDEQLLSALRALDERMAAP